MINIKIYIYDEEVTVTGEYLPGQTQTRNQEGFADEFHVYGSDSSYSICFIQSEYEQDILDEIKYLKEQSELEAMING